jgi:histidinol-phosphate aminotransferase
MNFNIYNLLRDNIKRIINNKTSENQCDLDIKIRLDNNENALGSPLTKWYHRYPDSDQSKLKDAIGMVKNILTIHHSEDLCMVLIVCSYSLLI